MSIAWLQNILFKRNSNNQGCNGLVWTGFQSKILNQRFDLVFTPYQKMNIGLDRFG